jgi:hypothetical protein
MHDAISDSLLSTLSVYSWSLRPNSRTPGSNVLVGEAGAGLSVVAPGCPVAARGARVTAPVGPATVEPDVHAAAPAATATATRADAAVLARFDPGVLRWLARMVCLAWSGADVMAGQPSARRLNPT